MRLFMCNPDKSWLGLRSIFEITGSPKPQSLVRIAVVAKHKNWLKRRNYVEADRNASSRQHFGRCHKFMQK